MLGHVKRHVNKGETKSRYISASTTKSSNEVLKETDTDIQVFPNYSIPQKTDSYFNPKMKLNRQIIFCTLAALAEERKPLECLDAFGATGIMGLQWAKHLGNAVKVTINDLNENSVTLIQKNCHLNKLKVVVDSEEEEEDDDKEEEEVLGTRARRLRRRREEGGTERRRRSPAGAARRTESRVGQCEKQRVGDAAATAARPISGPCVASLPGTAPQVFSPERRKH